VDLLFVFVPLSLLFGAPCFFELLLLLLAVAGRRLKTTVGTREFPGMVVVVGDCVIPAAGDALIVNGDLDRAACLAVNARALPRAVDGGGMPEMLLLTTPPLPPPPPPRILLDEEIV